LARRAGEGRGAGGGGRPPASASPSWAAVTPDPQYEPAMAPPGSPAAAVTPSAANRARSSGAGRKRPSARTLPAVGPLTAPGICPATGAAGPAAVTLPGPRVQQRARASQVGGAARVQPRHAAGPGREVPRRRGAALAGGYGLPGRGPGAIAAIEDPDPGVPEVAQRPPAARRRGGVRLVVDHDVPPVAHPGPPHGQLERRRLRQRVTPARPRCPRQVAVEVGE